eukprot:m.613503 g.613503  ORF g.613503 m.613503 type:complete len:263 (+) comp22502_c0_seq12:1368-2156(+)
MLPLHVGAHYLEQRALETVFLRRGLRLICHPRAPRSLTVVFIEDFHAHAYVCLDAECMCVCRWQGERIHGFNDSQPGQCFMLGSCAATEPYDTPISHDFCIAIERCSRPLTSSVPNAFDSHICFAAARPIELADGIRVYYMGGNGPHSGDRNSSFAVAHLGLDRYAGVGGTGNLTTAHAVAVHGPKLVISADVRSGGFVRIGIRGAAVLGVTDCVPVTANATRAAVEFKSNMTFAHFVGTSITVEIHVHRSTIYAFGFPVVS